MTKIPDTVGYIVFERNGHWEYESCTYSDALSNTPYSQAWNDEPMDWYENEAEAKTATTRLNDMCSQLTSDSRSGVCPDGEFTGDDADEDEDEDEDGDGDGDEDGDEDDELWFFEAGHGEANG